MKTKLLFYIGLGWTVAGLYGADPAAKEEGAKELPARVRFSGSVRELVAAVNAGDTQESLRKLRTLESGLLAHDPDRPRSEFLSALRHLDPKVLGTFEDGLVARYKTLMTSPDSLSESDRQEVEMIAAVAREAMSKRLGELFLRDVKKVEPYVFKEVLNQGGWRPRNVDDWKGLQGRLVAGSIASDDLAILKRWISLADASQGDLRLLIWWGLGYSLREEAFNYLLAQYARGLEGREKMVVEFALNWSVQRMATYVTRLEKYQDYPFGALTPEEVRSLRARLLESAPKLQQRLKDAGILMNSAAGLYMD